MKFAERLAIRLAILGLGAGCGVPIVAQERSAPQQPQAQQSQPAHQSGDEQKETKETPVPPEKSSVTHHELSMSGRPLKYTATAGRC